MLNKLAKAIKKKSNKERQLYELVGAGKMLDILWTNSYYSMGKEASERIKKEMIYYFGEDWPTNMYKLIEKDDKHNVEPLKTLTDLSLE